MDEKRVNVRHSSPAEKFVLAFTLSITVFAALVQILIIQPEIGLVWLFAIPSMMLTSVVLVNYWKCVCTDSTVRSMSSVPNVQTEGWRYCPYSGCSGSVPDNSRHCHQCDTCVVQRDHHCHFTATCIGQNNLPYFMVLALSMFLLTVIYCLGNIIYIASHETPATLLLTLLAPIQILFYFLGYVTGEHCLISLNVVITTSALIGAIVLLYHEYGLLFYNRPYLTRSMPIGSSGVVTMSKMERIREVFGKRWYMFFIDPTHQSGNQRESVLTKDF